MDNKYDVIISGAGPSGSLLGFLLSEKNIKTLIIEKENFPRYKTCGGGIQHRTLNLLPFNINEVIENTIYGIYFSRKNEDVFSRKFDLPIMYTVERKNFDTFLSKKAGEKGCSLVFGEKVEGFENNDNNVKIFTNKGKKYVSKILVGADGIRGTVHRLIVKNNKIKKILGYETEIPLSDNNNGNEEKYLFRDNNDNTFVFNDSIRLDFNGVKKGYCWIFPKKDHLSCGMGTSFWDAKNMKKYFKMFLSQFFLNHINSNNQKIYAQCIPVRNPNTPICDYRVLNIGDAACLGDGFTGEGLYNSFKSSFLACDSISNALKSSVFDFKDYENKIKDDIYREIKISLFFTKIFFSSFPFFYALLKKNDNLFVSCCRILRGEKTYSEIAGKLRLIKF